MHAVAVRQALSGNNQTMYELFDRAIRDEYLKEVKKIDIGRRSPAFPVTPPDMRVRIRRFGGLSYRQTVNLGIPSESK
jgi:hypothetical protein